jgi:hypothetical protein
MQTLSTDPRRQLIPDEVINYTSAGGNGIEAPFAGRFKFG